MDKNQQIAAIKSGLAAVDSAIAQSEAGLRAASNLDDIRGLTSALVDLRSERSRLQAQLDNLEASTVEVLPPVSAPAPAPAASVADVIAEKEKKIQALHQELAGALADRSVVDATLKFAAGVHERAKNLRELMAGPAGG